jgi:hypothetical protein
MPEPEIAVSSTTDTQAQTEQAASEDWRNPAPDSQQVAETTKPDEVPPPPPPAAPKKSKVERRIDELTWRNSELQRQLEQALGTAERATQALTERREGSAQDVTPEGSPNATEIGEGKRYRTYEDYVAALARWNAQEVYREHNEQAAEERNQAALRETYDGYNQRVQTFAAEHPDFHDTLGADVMIPQTAGLAIVEMENGPEVAYWLGKNPAEAAKLHGMSELQQVMELGRISARLTGQNGASQPPPAPRPVSNARPPVTTVGGTANTTPKAPEEMTHQEYRRWRQNQGARI